jgi:hypothetical protein
VVAVAATIFVIVIVSLLLSQWLLTLGRSLDFIPHTPAPPALVRFRQLHLAYTGLDLLKLFLCVWLLIRSTRQTHPVAIQR